MARAESRGITPQSEDFSAWYNELVLKAELVDRGPVRGTMVIRPYGYRIWELLVAELDAKIKQTGHENAYFPLLIPEAHLKKEADHVEGFAPELAVVTHAGGEDLEEPLVVRPTSETVIGETYARWIDSYRDLPLLINQWSNIVRWELRPRLLLRTTEFLWQEGHTAHVDEEDATREVLVATGFYEEVVQDHCAIPVIVGDKTPTERFPGAVRTVTLEAMMRDGRALQAGTSHYLGTNFAEAFDITYTGADGVRTYCHTASWGMSTRVLGGIVMVHGDDRGLILPPRVAPHQVVIVPIGKDEEFEKTATAGQILADSLRSKGVRVHVDTRSHVSAGFKFNDWELHGVPIRVELGPRDLASDSVVVANRLEHTKQSESTTDFVESISDRLSLFQSALYERAITYRDEHTRRVDSLDELVAAVESGFAYSFHCGDEACERRFQELTGATPRCIPRDEPDADGICPICGKPSAYGKRIVFARAY
ncbi:MAG: proline--tRNA ligase [Acidimicrobiales bacterium]